MNKDDLIREFPEHEIINWKQLYRRKFRFKCTVKMLSPDYAELHLTKKEGEQNYIEPKHRIVLLDEDYVISKIAYENPFLKDITVDKARSIVSKARNKLIAENE